MDNFNNKLLTADSTIVIQIISKLVNYIRSVYKEGKEIEELSLLKSKCVCSDTKLSEAAAIGILKLIEDGVVNHSKLLEEFITLIPNNKISSGIVKTVSGVLCHQFGNRDTVLLKFNLHLPQHPFITLLINDADCLPYIYNEVRVISRKADIGSYWNNLNYPFYQYCLCNPSNKKINFYQIKLWINILQTSTDTELITKLIFWMIFDSTSSILITTELLNELTAFCCKSQYKNINVLIMLQSSVCYHLLSKNFDPRITLENIGMLISKMLLVECSNPVLLMLVKALIRVPYVHALDVLQIIDLVIRQRNVNCFVLEAVKVGLLHWIGNPSLLTTEIVTKATDMFMFIQTSMKQEKQRSSDFHIIFKTYMDIISSNQEVYFACKQSVLCESWIRQEEIVDYLKLLKTCDVNFIRRSICLVYGLFVSDFSNSEIVLISFEIICLYIEHFNKFTHLVLTLLLYKLSNTSDSNVQFKLLNFLPKLASVNSNENFIKVVTTIKVLFSGTNIALKTLGMSLMYDLWCINNKAYPYLEDVLSTPANAISSEKWEYYVNKAYIIKKICENNPKLYGEEMVAHLSRILNECSTPDGELASSICLDAITVLCKAGITDIHTTWSTLAPKFLGDRRVQVGRSFCGLAAAMADLLDTEQHPELTKEIIMTIWKYVIENEELEVKTAALNALAEFGLENISPYVPDLFLDEDLSTDVKPQLVPGSCWIKFLKYQSGLSSAGDFLIKMIGKEIDDYFKSVYHISAKKEPIHYTYLPNHSIVRGIADYCKNTVLKRKGLNEPMYIECMRILSQEYSKPLPPYNWNFLHELFHDPKVKVFCVDIASHQVRISGTARTMMENIIYELATDFKNVEGALMIYRNLKYLANSIQPMILGPFFNNTLNYGGYLLKEEHKKDFIMSIVASFKEVLTDETIQEVSKRTIVANIDEKLDVLDPSDEMFDILLNCVPYYPIILMENITKLNSPDDMTTALFSRAVKIRTALAKFTKDLKWLDDLIELGKTNHIVAAPLKDYLHLFGEENIGIGCVQWTIDLIGRIEATSAENCENMSLIFLIDILVVAVVEFSGFRIFSNVRMQIQEYLVLFPRAAALLMESKEWHKCCSMALECFYYLNTNEKDLLPREYQNAFGQALQALRSHPEFKKNNKWLKYLNAVIYFENCL